MSGPGPGEVGDLAANRRLAEVGFKRRLDPLGQIADRFKHRVVRTLEELNAEKLAMIPLAMVAFGLHTDFIGWEARLTPSRPAGSA